MVAAPATRRAPPRSMRVALAGLGFGALCGWAAWVFTLPGGIARGPGLSGLMLTVFMAALLSTGLAGLAFLAMLAKRRWLWTTAMVVSSPLAFVLFLLALPSVLMGFSTLIQGPGGATSHWSWLAIIPVWCAAWSLPLVVELFRHHAVLSHTRGATVPAV